MNTNSHGSPIPSESERKQERKRREETGLANSVRGGGAPVRSPVPERTDDDGQWRLESGDGGGSRMRMRERERGNEREQTAWRGRNGD